MQPILLVSAGVIKLSIYKKVRAVEKVFDTLDKDIALFQKESGLSCLAACGKCCTKPDIEASILEFLPLAYYLYKQNKAFEYLERIENAAEVSTCFLLQPFLGQNDKGFCGDYLYRGLICRVFGFTGRRDKYGNKNLVTCKTIKVAQAEVYNSVSAKINSSDQEVPMMNNYSMMLYAIDFNLASKYYPINEAVRLAIETVLSYYSYRSRKIG